MCSRVHSDPVKPGCFGGLEVVSSTPKQAQIVAPADLIRSAAIAVSASRVEAAMISLIAGLDFATNQTDFAPADSNFVKDSEPWPSVEDSDQPVVTSDELSKLVMGTESEPVNS